MKGTLEHGSQTIMEALKKQTEQVVVTLKLPIGMSEFLQHLSGSPLAGQSLEEFAKDAVLAQFQALLDALPWTIFDSEGILHHYGLREIQSSEVTRLAATAPM